MSLTNSDRVELNLFRHRESDSGKAVLLSPNGARTHAQWVPKSLVDEPVAPELVHPSGGADRCHYGRFKLARFKAREFGWEQLADDSADLFAHGKNRSQQAGSGA